MICVDISYRVSTDSPEGCLFRMVKSANGLNCQQWSVVKNKWVDSEVACGAFVGFEPSMEISEQEAMRIIKEDAERYANGRC